jgi:hypothetical protein
MCPLLLRVLKGWGNSKKSLELGEENKWPEVRLNVMCNKLKKHLTLSQSIEKLQHFKISFDGKHQRDYWQF